MSGYDLSREWFDYMAKNSDKVELKHTALYMYIVEMFNKRDWVEVIGLPTDFTMSVLNIKSYKTYKSILDDLIAFGFVNLVTRATNDHTSNKITLVKNAKVNTKVKPKYVPKLIQSNDQSKSESCSTYINIKTLKPKTLKLINENASLIEQCLECWILDHTKPEKDDFEKAWELYGKKGNKKNAQKRWEKVTTKDFESIMNHIPIYMESVSDRKYLKDFEGYLNQEHWKSELVNSKSTKPQVEYIHFYSPSTGNSVLTRDRFESRKKSYEPLGEIFEILRTEWKDAD